MQASDLRVRCSKVLSWSADQVPYVSEEERILTFTARLSAFTGFILLPFHVSQCGIYFIWHPRPGYPDQEISEPDAQGRVAYKIHMTTAASQLPSRQTDAQRAAELIYRSVIKKHGNP
jgi:hypothetical protein